MKTEKTGETAWEAAAAAAQVHVQVGRARQRALVQAHLPQDKRICSHRTQDKEDVLCTDLRSAARERDNVQKSEEGRIQRDVVPTDGYDQIVLGRDVLANEGILR